MWRRCIMYEYRKELFMARALPSLLQLCRKEIGADDLVGESCDIKIVLYGLYDSNIPRLAVAVFVQEVLRFHIGKVALIIAKETR